MRTVRSRFPRTADVALERFQLLVHGAGGVALDLAVARDKLFAEGSEHRAAAVLAAGLRLDRGMPANAVDLVDEIQARL